jgi:hypothetical protein
MDNNHPKHTLCPARYFSDSQLSIELYTEAEIK